MNNMKMSKNKSFKICKIRY